MSLRVICVRVSTTPEGINMGSDYKTFPIESPELESWLRNQHGYEQKTVVGAEIVDENEVKS